MRDPGMYEDPLCAEVGGDFWYPEVGAEGVGEAGIRTAKSICGKCIHKNECAEWGIVNETFGIWGGLVPLERIKLRKTRGIRVRENWVA